MQYDYFDTFITLLQLALVVMAIPAWAFIGFVALDRISPYLIDRWMRRSVLLGLAVLVVWPLVAPIAAWQRRRRRGATYLDDRSARPSWWLQR